MESTFYASGRLVAGFRHFFDALQGWIVGGRWTSDRFAEGDGSRFKRTALRSSTMCECSRTTTPNVPSGALEGAKVVVVSRVRGSTVARALAPF